MEPYYGNAQTFMDAVRALGSAPGDSPPLTSLPEQGARAMARFVLDQPAVRDGEQPSQVLRLFGEDADEGLSGLRYDALGFLVGGALALGMTGKFTDDFAEALLIAALDPDPQRIAERKDLLREPFSPDDPVLPDWVDRLDRLREGACWAGVIGAVAALGKYGAARSTSDANGITSLSSKKVCPGAVLDILGSGFGATQPAGVSVYLPDRSGGCRPATVRSWSAGKISVDVPAGIGPGCVGFVRDTGGTFGGLQQVTGELTACVGAVGEIWGRGFSKVSGPIVSCPPCLPGGPNRIDVAGLPIIHQFAFSPDHVQPGGRPVLSWNVENADDVSIVVYPSFPPPPGVSTSAPSSGTLTIPPVTGTVPITVPWQLTAKNGCGSVSATAQYSMTEDPQLSVTAIEVVQSVQRSDNSVRLTALRRTAVRVYVSSGITDGFDRGLGPNKVRGVTASLFAENLDTGAVRDCGAPWNPNRIVSLGSNRDMLDDSFNFDVPVAACTGRVRFRAVVQMPGPVGSPPVSWATGSVDVEFTPKSAQELLPWIFTDPLSTAATPTLTDFFDNLTGPARRQPFPEAGFIVNPPIMVTLLPTESLKTWSSWERLVLRMTMTIFLFPSTPVGGIRSGIAPADPSYPWAGMALPRVGATAPSFVAQAMDSDGCAHELAHTYGLLHANCGSPAGPYGALPLTVDQPALDVVGRTLLATGAHEQMTYCGPRWVSIDHWDYIFNSIPI